MLDDIKGFLIHFSREKILSYEKNQGTSISFDFVLFVAEREPRVWTSGAGSEVIKSKTSWHITQEYLEDALQGFLCPCRSILNPLAF